jgi:hypothetical protein
MEADVSSKIGLGRISKKFELEASVRKVHGDELMTLSEKAVYPTCGGFFGLDAPIIGEMHPTGTSQSHVRCALQHLV